MSGIDRETVRRVARLARLELSGEEIERLAEEMEDVLSRFAELEAAENAAGGGFGGEGEAPAEHPPPGTDRGAGETTLRPDRPDADTLDHGPAEMAPAWEEGHFLVPRLEALGREGAPSGSGAGRGPEGEEDGG